MLTPEWDNHLTGDLQITSDHAGTGYTLVISWDTPLEEFEEWSGDFSSDDQQ